MAFSSQRSHLRDCWAGFRRWGMGLWREAVVPASGRGFDGDTYGAVGAGQWWVGSSRGRSQWWEYPISANGGNPDSAQGGVPEAALVISRFEPVHLTKPYWLNVVELRPSVAGVLAGVPTVLCFLLPVSCRMQPSPCRCNRMKQSKVSNHGLPRSLNPLSGLASSSGSR